MTPWTGHERQALDEAVGRHLTDPIIEVFLRAAFNPEEAAAIVGDNILVDSTF